jgi:O-antigen ligase
VLPLRAGRPRIAEDGSAARARTRSSARSWASTLTIAVLLGWASSFVVGFENAVLGLTALGFAAALAGLRSPVLGLFGVSLLCTIDPVTRVYVMTGGVFRWNSFSYLLVVVSVLFFRRCISWRDPAVRFLALLLVVLSLGLIFSSNPRQGLQNTLEAASFIGLLVYVERAGFSSDVWVWNGVVCGVAGAAGGFVFFLQDETVTMLSNPNAWAHFPLTALAMVALALSRASPSTRIRTLLLPLAMINASWVLLSGSRGASLTAAVWLLFCITQGGRAWAISAFAALILAAVILTAGLFEARQERALQRFMKLVDPAYSLAGRTSGRSELARTGFNLFLEHPISGVGTGSFASAWFRQQDARGLSQYGVGRDVAAHSGWIKTMAENGLPGLLLLAGFVLSFAVVGWRQRERGARWLGLTIAVALSIALLSTEFQSKGLWLVAAAGTLFLRPQGSGRRIARSARPPGRRDGYLVAHG